MLYKVRNENKRVPKKVNSNLTLHKACSDIERVPGGVVLNDLGKLVAFFCVHRQQVRPGFAATEAEKHMISAWYEV